MRISRPVHVTPWLSLALLASLAMACGGTAKSGPGAAGQAGTGATGQAGMGAAGQAGSGAAGQAGTGAGTQAGTAGQAGTGATGQAGTGATGQAGTGATGQAGTGATGQAGHGGAGTGAAGQAGHGVADGGADASPGTGDAGDASGAHDGGVWAPKPGTTWQWQLTGAIDTTVDAQVYDIDLFTTDASVIKALHSGGRVVICYFSAGSYEPDRPDSAALAKTGLGSTLDGWPDEKWLDVRSAAVRDIMRGRLDTARTKGCDGVEPDNVDGYDNANGLGLTEADQVDYDTFLATEAHARGLSVGLKNSLGLVTKLVGRFDWALNEECLKYKECSELQPFISAGKAVFHCEYASSTAGICDKRPAGFSTIVKHLSLDAWRLACP
jgi:hypothetical protein